MGAIHLAYLNSLPARQKSECKDTQEKNSVNGLGQF